MKYNIFVWNKFKTTVIWSALLGWWLFDEPLTATAALGIGLIILAGGLLSRRANAET